MKITSHWQRKSVKPRCAPRRGRTQTKTDLQKKNENSADGARRANYTRVPDQLFAIIETITNKQTGTQGITAPLHPHRSETTGNIVISFF